MNNGAQERRDLNGVVTGEFTPYQFVPQLSLAAEVIKGFSLGLSLKVPYEVIDDYANLKPLFDLGANLKVIERLYAGVNAQNLGASENLPGNLRAGLAYIGREINLCLDYSAPAQAVSTLSLGLEVKALEMFTFRAGYRNKLGVSAGFENGISAGFGAKIEMINIDYGYKTYGELGATHYLSLALGLK